MKCERKIDRMRVSEEKFERMAEYPLFLKLHYNWKKVQAPPKGLE